ncbi:MAG: zinc ribbon domain-containing protein [Blautia sp.]|nr:zinc ribbon domain-containing protein [Blautia sp.]
MGGYRVNGCGVTDHFKKVKDLGPHLCPKCGKTAEFTLEEAKQKIDVLWIPTFTLKSRYAVICRKCKEGEFCSNEWAGYLMMIQPPIEVVFESEARKRGWSPATMSFREMVSQQPAPERLTQALQSGSERQPVQTPQIRPVSQSGGTGSKAPDFFKCAYCGVTQMREGKFCAYCGKPAPGETGAESAADTGDITCAHCGAKIKKGLLFCMECGTKV